jgi:chromosome segregation ATPase
MNTEITSKNDIDTEIAAIQDQLDGVTSEMIELRTSCNKTDISLEKLWDNHEELDDRVERMQQSLEIITSYVKEILGIILDSTIDKDAKDTASRLLAELDEEKI